MGNDGWAGNCFRFRPRRCVWQPRDLLALLPNRKSRHFPVGFSFSGASLAIRSCSVASSWLLSASALNVVTKYSQWLMVQKGVKYIVPFFMRVAAGPCPRAPSFPDFHQEFFFARLRPDSAPARMTGLNLLCAVALPGMIYPEDTAFKSTRPPESGSPATDLRRWGGASGDPVRN